MARLRRSRAVWGAGAGLVILGLAIALWKIITIDSQTGLVVDLGYASYRGQSLHNGVSHWLGMRYAAPPVADLRFAAPQDPPSVKGTQDAVTHGSICIPTPQNPIPKNHAEDCLFIDVYAPTTPVNGTKLPVFVYIQGGGYNLNANPNYNGTGLIMASDMNIVVVTFNYRVGPYGFLAGEEIQKGGSLNNGIKDMIKALEWVHQYIDKFGGDPNHVTVGGDSAGAGAITLLLTAYGGVGLPHLIHATAAESQSFGTQLNVEGSQFSYDNLTERTGCAREADTLACLRGLDVHALQKENFNVPFPGATKLPLYMYGPTIDGNLVSDYTYRLFNQGKFMKIPVIFGDDTNEGTVWAPHNTSSVAEADEFIRANFATITQTELDQINNIYMSAPDDPVYPGAGKYWQGASNAYGEIRYICPGIFVSNTYAGFNQTLHHNWNYHYAVIDATSTKSGYGTPHTIEVNAIWGRDGIVGLPPASYLTTNADIVPLMQGYWTSFIRSFDPNTHRAPGSPEWQAWGSGSNAFNRIFIRTNETKMETVSADQQKRCSYLQSIAVDLRH